MARKYCKPPQIPYRYDKPSARCPLCRSKLFEQIWLNGERVYTTRPHCSSFSVVQKEGFETAAESIAREEEIAAQTQEV